MGRYSALRHPFSNKWLNLAIVWEFLLFGLILYLPFLQNAFQTAPLPLEDWLIVVALAATVTPVLEIAK